MGPPRTLVMGVLNLTPDSFSDGGRWAEPGEATRRLARMRAEGADIIDIGGESSRPGGQRVSAEEELSRLRPVLAGLAGLANQPDPPVLSIDTRRASVARAAVAAGVGLINDVSGGLADPDMLDLVAELGVDYVCQRWRAVPGDGPRAGPTAEPLDGIPRSADDLVPAAVAELAGRRDACLAAGIAPQRVILDPGVGFQTSAGMDWAILAHLEEFAALGHRLLIGASRKRFLAEVAEPDDQDSATAAVTAWCAQHGVWAVRVHDLPPNLAAVRVAARLLCQAHPRGTLIEPSREAR